MTVLHGKGDQRRTVGMDPAAFALLERWLDKRRALGLYCASVLPLRAQVERVVVVVADVE